jgi:hypothetical protein
MYGFPLKYVGQMGRTFYTRYKNIQAIRNNKGTSENLNRILSTEHAYGNITDILSIIKTEKKEKPKYI